MTIGAVIVSLCCDGLLVVTIPAVLAWIWCHYEETTAAQRAAIITALVLLWLSPLILRCVGGG